MGILLQEFLSLGRISTRYAELVKKQYQKFFTVIDQNQKLFSSFNPTNDRVDTLFQKRCDRQMNMEIFGNSSKFFWFCFMVNQKLKEGSVSIRNFLLKTSKQNLWSRFEELKITWIFWNLALKASRFPVNWLEVWQKLIAVIKMSYRNKEE